MTHNTTKHTSQDISETSHLLTEEPTSKPKFDFRKLRLLNVGHIKWFVLLKGLHVRLVKLGLQEKWFVLLGTICLFAASGVGLLIPNYVGNLVDQISKIETGYVRRCVDGRFIIVELFITIDFYIEWTLLFASY